MMRVVAAALSCVALAACGRSPETPDTAATPTPVAAPTPAPSAAPASLARFVGHYPFDVVGGARFLQSAAVRARVEALAPDADVAATVLAGDGPATPIVERDGRILSWGCEAHNCGPHNWAILIAPDGSRAQLCYKPDGQDARWYGGVPAGADAATCPSGDEGEG